MDRRRVVPSVILCCLMLLPGAAAVASAAPVGAPSGGGSVAHSSGTVSAPGAGFLPPSAGFPAIPVIPVPSARPAVTPVALTVIYPNGTVSNASAPITVSGNIYTFTSGFTGGILDERNGSSLEGHGTTLRIDTSLSVGVTVLDATNVTVSGLHVAGDGDGVEFEATQAGEVTGCDLTVTGWAVYGAAESGMTVASNTVTGGEGLLFNTANGTTVSGNTLTRTRDWAVLGEFVSDFNATDNVADDNGVVGNGIVAAWGADVSFTGNNVTHVSIGVYNFQVTDSVLDNNSIVHATTALLLDDAQDVTGWGNAGQSGGLENVGIEIYASTGVRLSAEQFPAAAQLGLLVQNSQQIDVRASAFNNSGENGTSVQESSGVSLEADDVAGFEGSGVYLNGSTEVEISDVNASYASAGGTYGILALGGGPVTIAGSWADGDPQGLHADATVDLTINGSAFEHETGTDAVLLYGTDGALVEGSNLSYANGTALLASDAGSLSVLANVAVGDVSDGFIFDACSDVVVGGNLLRPLAGVGIGLEFGGGGEIFDNSLSAPAPGAFGEGIYALQESDLSITNNSIENAETGLLLNAFSFGLVDGNAVTGGATAIELFDTVDLTVEANLFANATDGFEILANLGARIFHNNFVNDSGWVNLGSFQQIAWDAGYPVGGNYWSNFTGPDEWSGPGQNLSGPDGIVDLPFEINVSNVDHYPLARPWSSTGVQFEETGLPDGTDWAVTVDGTRLAGSQSALLFEDPDAANESFAYSVAAVPGYSLTSPSSGSVAMDGANQTVVLSFQPVEYALTFTESGLKNGTAWSVHVDGQALNGTTDQLSLEVPNGSYDWSAGPVSGYALTSPYGTVLVDASSASVSVTYVALTTIVQGGGNNSTQGGGNTSQGGGGSGGSGGGSSGGGSGGTGGGSGGGSGGSGGGSSGGTGTTTTKTTTSSPSRSFTNDQFYALLAALIAACLAAVVGFALYARARRGAGSSPPHPWSPSGSAAPAAPSTTPAPVVAPVAKPPAAAPSSAAWSEDPPKTGG